MALKAKMTALAILCFASFAANATNEHPTTLPDFTDKTGDWVTQTMLDWMDGDGDEFPTFTDEEYTQRLKEMSGAIQYKLHPMVKEVILARTEKYRSSTERVLGLSDVYFAIFEEHLAKYNVPHHLKYLPIIESRLEPVARSYAGAVGLWQFIPSTGKMYGLQMNSSVDERSDTYKASEAAARMLSELHTYYNGDWALALASYNCGPGRVNRAIKDAGTTDYWVVRNFLPTETQKYVPYFMAVAYIGEYYELHELEPIAHAQDLVLTDTIMIYSGKSLYQFAQELQFNADTLRQLNPSYLKGYVPGNATKGNIVVLPNRIVAKLRGYEARYQEIMAEQPENPIKVIRRVNSIEDLDFLAKAHRCSLRDIAAWNGLPENYVPQQGDVVAIRKYKPSADVPLETRRQIEKISIASLQVVGLDKKTKAMTESVYANINPAFAHTSMIAMLVPQQHTTKQADEATNIAAASNLPVMPTTSAMTAASLHAVAEPIQVQQLDESVSTTDLSDRSRDRRVRGTALVAASTATPTVEDAPVLTAEPAMVTNTASANNSALATAAAQAKALATQQEQAALHYQQQLEQQAQTALADQLGKQATEAIAARQNKPTVNETVASDNVVMGIVPTATADRSRDRNLRHTDTAVENAPIVAVSSDMQQDGYYLYHTVREKETIWDVRNRYPQMTVRDLMELNQLRSETELRTGMILKIRP